MKTIQTPLNKCMKTFKKANNSVGGLIHSTSEKLFLIKIQKHYLSHA